MLGAALVFGALIWLGWAIPQLLMDRDGSPADESPTTLPADAAPGTTAPRGEGEPSLRRPEDWQSVRGTWAADGSVVDLRRASRGNLLVERAEGVPGIAARARPAQDGWGLVVGPARSHLRVTLHPSQRRIRLQHVERGEVRFVSSVVWPALNPEPLLVLRRVADGVVLRLDGRRILEAETRDVGDGVGLTYTGRDMPLVSWRQVSLVLV